MPAQESKSLLLETLGRDVLASAFKAHINDEVDYGGGGGLPAGINGGVGRVIDCCFKKVKEGSQNAGKPMFYCRIVCVLPAEHKGVQDSIMRMLIDTPKRTNEKTVADHFGWCLNEIKKIAGPDCFKGVDPTKDPTAAERVCALITQLKPHTRFHTWKGPTQILEYKNGAWYVGDRKYASEDAAKAANPYLGKESRVQLVLDGACPAPPESAPGTGVTDNTAAAKNGHGPSTATRTPAKFRTQPTAPPQEEEEPPFDDFGDVHELVARAEAKDSEAIDALLKLAEEKGVPQEAVDKAPNWIVVGQLITGEVDAASVTGGGDEEDEPDAEDEESVPQADPVKGNPYYYRPTDQKGLKAKKPVEVEVLAVDKKKRTVNLKNLVNGKTYSGVSWDDLENIEA